MILKVSLVLNLQKPHEKSPTKYIKIHFLHLLRQTLIQYGSKNWAQLFFYRKILKSLACRLYEFCFIYFDISKLNI